MWEGKAFEKIRGQHPEIEEEGEWRVVPIMLSSLSTCTTFLLMTWVNNSLRRSVMTWMFWMELLHIHYFQLLCKVAGDTCARDSGPRGRGFWNSAGVEAF